MVINIAKKYYTAMGAKNVDALKEYLHSDVQYTGPIGEISGREAVLQAIKNFTDHFQSLSIRDTFGAENQAMVVYDIIFPDPIGKLRTAAMMTFQDGLISKIELFFDGRPIEHMILK